MAYMNETRKGIGFKFPKKETWKKVGRFVGKGVYEVADTMVKGFSGSSSPSPHRRRVVQPYSYPSKYRKY